MDKKNKNADMENDANGPDKQDGFLESEPVGSVSRIKHPDEVGNTWHICRDFIDPLVDEVEEWLHDAKGKGLDFTEPTTLDRLSYIIAGIVVDGPGSVPAAAAWWRARAWCDVNGKAEFRDQFVKRVENVWDEIESLERRLDNWRPNNDSLDENEECSRNGQYEFQGFMITVVTPFIADLRNWSLELEKQFPVQPNTPSDSSIEDGNGGSSKLESSQKPKRKPKPSEFKAYIQYKEAIRRNAILVDASDKEIYEWVWENVLDHGEKLPKLATWEKQLRTARSYYGQQKNGSRINRQYGKSIVREDQI